MYLITFERGFKFNGSRKMTQTRLEVGDKNFHDKHSGFFIEVNLAYGINKFNYAYNKNFPGSLYQNEKFIALNAGIRF